MSLVAHLVPITEPLRIHIPAGWFSMGSNSGQDVEAPFHRVWVDSFDMAATQVTVDEYARFLDATGGTAPAFWGDPGYYAISPERNPQGPEEGTRKASRGGSWRHHIKVSSCSARS